jgi:hypothetical protein
MIFWARSELLLRLRQPHASVGAQISLDAEKLRGELISCKRWNKAVRELGTVLAEYLDTTRQVETVLQSVMVNVTREFHREISTGDVHIVRHVDMPVLFQGSTSRSTSTTVIPATWS